MIYLSQKICDKSEPQTNNVIQLEISKIDKISNFEYIKILKYK